MERENKIYRVLKLTVKLSNNGLLIKSSLVCIFNAFLIAINRKDMIAFLLLLYLFEVIQDFIVMFMTAWRMMG